MIRQSKEYIYIISLYTKEKTHSSIVKAAYYMTHLNLKSSNNNISGDERTNLLEAFLYCFIFFIELITSKKFKDDSIIPTNKEDLLRFWGNNDWKNYSPSRIACDMFLVNYLKENFSFNKTIVIIDIGCGNGHYSTLIRNLGFKINYLGVDIKERDMWKDMEDESTKFLELELGVGNTELLQNLTANKVHLIFSHSCLEHIKNDISALIEIEQSFPLVKQLHLVPAPISFLNYFKHGYRRYSEKNFLKISQHLKSKLSFTTLGNHFLVKSYFYFFYNKYNVKHKFDFLNFYKKKVNFEELLREISPKKNNFPVYYAIEINPK